MPSGRPNIYTDGRTSTCCYTLSPTAREAVERYAEAQNTTKSQAANHLILRGAQAADTAASTRSWMTAPLQDDDGAG